jgi:hypothetical protein
MDTIHNYERFTNLLNRMHKKSHCGISQQIGNSCLGDTGTRSKYQAQMN